jgi:glycosyltransferase involved in cell wall biosynthesis
LFLRVVRQCDTLWINDANVGAWLVNQGRATYDVTDDWRSMDFTSRELHRLIAAEDLLATRARTIVCSEELGRRWNVRYGVESSVVRNASDSAAIRSARPRHLGVDQPHLGYVGTLHESRLDIDLLLQIADAIVPGRVHLVGPDNLTERGRARLTAHPNITLHGTVPAFEVPSWLVAFDVLICPHVVTEFTRSLDAIKAYEYLATARPVVATPSSGFQELEAPGLYVGSDDFVAAVCRAAVQKETFRRDVPNWDDRAREFAAALSRG